MRNRITPVNLWLTISTMASLFLTANLDAAASDLARGFASPPQSAKPWVYWFWLDGNITREGITADLEAMRRVGIGGVLIMEVDQGAPPGPARFASPQWRELFKFMLTEAKRLGLEVNMNNDAGWCGSGGPWIPPALAMQKVVWTTTNLDGPRRFEGVLPEPQRVANYYEDIAVLAFPTPAEYQIENIQAKAAFIRQEVPFRKLSEPLPVEKTIARGGSRELTAQMGKDGRLAWDVPPGKWTVLRLGHTPTGKDNHPAPLDGRGLECDKLSRKAADAMFEGLMGKLIADSKALAGKTLVATHIDSWEVGSQNWTLAFREEFKRLRGYDPLPFLPVMTGRVVESLEVSERFLWDLRQTISELVVANYAGRFRELAHEHGLRLSIEAYDGCCDDMTYAGQADEPMGEFWSWTFGSGADWCTEMASAAHIYGKPILGAEAFTATDKEKWLGHPGGIKALGDWAFCEGINRFVFHRYALQPWRDVKPGMSMGPWGLHYERTTTWWEQSTAWHEYLSRCQYLLQQGQFIADVCYLSPEASPYRFRAPPTPGNPSHRPAYNFDGCTPEAVLTRMKVKGGRLVLPSGMSYRVLVLPEVETMTPKLLRKVRDLVEAGATVVGPAPLRSPSLSNFPQCDEEIATLTRELWGGGAGEGTSLFGRGRVIWPIEQREQEPQDMPARLGSAKWIWFKEGNPAAAVPAGRRYFRRVLNLEAAAEVESAPMVMTADNEFELWVNGRRAGGGADFNHTFAMDCARLLVPGSNLLAVAAVNGADAPNPAALIGNLIIKYRSGRTIQVPTDGKWESARTVQGDWRGDVQAPGAWEPALEVGALGMAPWGDVTAQAQAPYPSAEATAVLLRKLGVPPDFDYATQSTERSLRYIHKRLGKTDLYFVANEKPHPEAAVCSFRVQGKRPELWWPDSGKIEQSAVYDETGGCVRMPIHFDASGSVFVMFRPGGDLERDRIIAVERNGEALVDLRKQELSAPVLEEAVIGLVRGKAGTVQADVRKPGKYALVSADGSRREFEADTLPEPLEITGPWQVRFAPGGGAPAQVTLDRLISWSQHGDSGVRYFSGTATYHRTFDLPTGFAARHRRLCLDLGRVEVMAEVKLNGKNLGILWKQPYCVDVTDTVKPGQNKLELAVVNLWPNRQIGDERLPEDSERNPNGTLKQWPQWLLDGKPSPTGRHTFTSWRLWQRDSPLVESGLLGPVTLRPAERVMLSPK
ncbi:MAG TPA: glycosyl hydrolase [Candidatus Paceibacterota bacterium]|nr:glycosyl hydrolase [Verrucomicrobiota bacterium]HSA11255.1 glycosyl hydrolase [Candidatus Paceibacterota bacterium]